MAGWKFLLLLLVKVLTSHRFRRVNVANDSKIGPALSRVAILYKFVLSRAVPADGHHNFHNFLTELTSVAGQTLRFSALKLQGGAKKGMGCNQPLRECQTVFVIGPQTNNLLSRNDGTGRSSSVQVGPAVFPGRARPAAGQLPVPSPSNGQNTLLPAHPGLRAAGLRSLRMHG